MAPSRTSRRSPRKKGWCLKVACTRTDKTKPEPALTRLNLLGTCRSTLYAAVSRLGPHVREAASRTRRLSLSLSPPPPPHPPLLVCLHVRRRDCSPAVACNFHSLICRPHDFSRTRFGVGAGALRLKDRMARAPWAHFSPFCGHVCSFYISVGKRARRLILIALRLNAVVVSSLSCPPPQPALPPEPYAPPPLLVPSYPSLSPVVCVYLLRCQF
jgi:hypothetical protein